jgi:hypothetical protein
MDGEGNLNLSRTSYKLTVDFKGVTENTVTLTADLRNAPKDAFEHNFSLGGVPYVVSGIIL